VERTNENAHFNCIVLVHADLLKQDWSTPEKGLTAVVKCFGSTTEKHQSAMLGSVDKQVITEGTSGGGDEK
jgi:hypothetical protein